VSNPVTLARIVPPVYSYVCDEHERRILQHNRDARPWATMHRAARLASDLTAERATSARLADRCLNLGKGQAPERIVWGPENGGDPPPWERPTPDPRTTLHDGDPAKRQPWCLKCNKPAETCEIDNAARRGRAALRRSVRRRHLPR